MKVLRFCCLGAWPDAIERKRDERTEKVPAPIGSPVRAAPLSRHGGDSSAGEIKTLFPIPLFSFIITASPLSIFRLRSSSLFSLSFFFPFTHAREVTLFNLPTSHSFCF